MPDIKFLAVLPQLSYSVKKIRIRGSLKQNAESFSINFVNESLSCSPQNITYHLKLIVNRHPQLMIQNTKRDGEWDIELEQELEAFNGRFQFPLAETNFETAISAKNGYVLVDAVADSRTMNLSSTDQSFGLEFTLNYDTDEIHVYNMHDDGFNYLTTYETSNALSQILAVQIWGDVDRIQEYTMLYD